MKLVDLNSNKVFREERNISVPSSDKAAPAPITDDADESSARLLAEANAAIANGDTTVKLIRPFGELKAGMQRFDTLTTGKDIEKVTFLLDGRALLTKKKPPFSVELDLGNLPRPRTLVAKAYNAGGTEVASDEMVVNAAPNRFQVRLVEPQRGKHYTNSLLAKAEPQAPDGGVVERVSSISTRPRSRPSSSRLGSSPSCCPRPRRWATCAPWPTCRTAARPRTWSSSTRPEDMAEVNINFVELYTSVLDKQKRPVEGLEQKDFAVTEDGTKQEISRFERVTNLSIHAVVALDISASMEKSLDKARQAALEFFQRTIRPKDRASVITFNDHPNLTVKFTTTSPPWPAASRASRPSAARRSTTASSSPSTTSPASRGSGRWC